MKSVAACLTVLFLAACGDPKATPDQMEAAKRGEASAGDDVVDCAVNAAIRFERVCAVERATGPDGLVLTVRHPSGGFRRLRVTQDGRGVVPADGAEPAAVTVIDNGHIEVAIGSDRYRLPATIRK